MIRFAWLLALLMACVSWTPSVRADITRPLPARALIWSVAPQSNTPAETKAADRIDIPARDVNVVSASVPDGLNGGTNPSLTVHYVLGKAPKNGVLLSLKLVDAPMSGAQIAVFSDGIMAGLLQLWGTSGTTSPYHWIRTYRLYIPYELLANGENEIKFETVRPMWSDASVDPQVWLKWGNVELEALKGPISEPIHGAVVYLGTTLKHSSHDFNVNSDTIGLAKVLLPWTGIAYSGNTIRADFWKDVSSSQPARLQYLQTLRDMNMTVCVDYITSGHFHFTPDGQIPDQTKSDLQAFFAQYGKLFQFYELGNEPCMFGGDYQEYLELAKYLHTIKPATVLLAAPGWAYGGGKGTPVNWDADYIRRQAIESYCDVINGHSYGYSYTANTGGSFVENLKTYGGVTDGWPKESLTTETGANDWHSEDNSTHFASTQPHIQAFDRILRAHIAVVTRTMQHALIFADLGLFKETPDLSDPTKLVAYPGVDPDTRLKVYRRLALAYATHGAPLHYMYVDKPAVYGKKVYFRAVDTSVLAPQSGSGAHSNKILLNFVNFENAPMTMKVAVTMPHAGYYSGDRFGAGNTYAEAHSLVTLKAGPAVTLSVNLGPGESVQYILQSGRH